MASFRKRGKTWEYRVSYTDNHGVKQVISNSGYRTKALAAMEAAEIERKYRRGAQMDRMDISLLEYWDTWIGAYKQGKHAMITESRYKTLRKALEGYWGDQKLREITKSDWQTFLNDYAAGPTDPKTHERKPRSKDLVGRLNGYVRTMVNNAIDDQIIYSNFTRGAVNPGHQGKSASLKYLEVADFARVKAYAFNHASLSAITYYVIATGIMTGARISEILALQWTDLDFKNKTVSISKSWDYVHNTGFKPTKTPSSVRTISVPDDLLKLLKQLKYEQYAYNLKTGRRDDKNLIFRNPLGQVPGEYGCNKTLHAIEDRLDIHPRITFHGLRHTHVSYLISKGCTITYISHRLGHSNIQITLTTYAHLLKDFENEQASKAVLALAEL